jgi:hypothetical protein
LVRTGSRTGIPEWHRALWFQNSRGSLCSQPCSCWARYCHVICWVYLFLRHWGQVVFVGAMWDSQRAMSITNDYRSNYMLWQTEKQTSVFQLEAAMQKLPYSIVLASTIKCIKLKLFHFLYIPCKYSNFKESPLAHLDPISFG